MARVTPATTFASPALEDHEPYPAKLTAIEWVTSSEQYGGEKRLQLDWELKSGESVRDWVGVRLGKQQSGQVSKLRALLNALVGKPESTEIAWFDDETLDFSYDGKDPYYALKVGDKVTLRGTSVTKEDGSHRFSVKVYQASKSDTAAVAESKNSDSKSEAPPW